MKRHVLVGLLTGCAGLAINHDAASQVTTDETIDLPVRDIVLYRSGVGYFERSGMIEAGSDVNLTFDREQVSDILKSLVVLTGEGLSIAGVTYDSEEPLARKLASYGIDVSDGPAMEEILDRIRGEQVVVRTSEGVKEGVIIGVQRSQRPVDSADGSSVVPTAQLNLLDGASMSTVFMDDVLGIRLVDETLAKDLADALAAIAADRTGGLATVRVGFDEGEGTGRGVRIGYVHEMPVWKATYRLVLPELSGSHSEGNALIQGWAIVENTTDTDWDDVQLSLAAGQPSSFRMDLYSPVFRTRPEVPVPLGLSFVAKAYEAVAQRLPANVSSRLRTAPPPAASPRGGAAIESLAEADLAYDASSMGEALATGSQRGAQFFYTVDGDVDVPRKTSAMLPMLVSEIPGERVSIFNPRDSQQHPVLGVRFENKSNLHLLPGPVTVVDGGAYAGDAQVGHTSRGETQLLSYAVDVDVNASVSMRSSDRVESVIIVNGSLMRQTKSVRTTTYAFTNDDAVRGRDLIVEHPKSPGYSLVTPRERDVDSTDSAYRVSLTLDRGDQEQIGIVEERVYNNRIAVSSLDLETLISYERSGTISKEVANAVRRAAQLQADKLELTKERDALVMQRRRLVDDQTRSRQNIESFERGTDARQRFVAKLLDAETSIEQIDQRLEQLDRQMSAKDTELNDFLTGLSLR